MIVGTTLYERDGAAMRRQRALMAVLQGLLPRVQAGNVQFQKERFRRLRACLPPAAGRA
jgi:hypothetical protein